ncbi:unnamed protein product [Rotaria sp. Silwood2]|nr:unnamed protein product [Rotaria sp. Silwood2]
MPQSLLSSEQELSVYFQMILKSCHSWVNKPIQHAVTAVHTVIRLDQAVRKEKAVSMRVDLIENLKTCKVTLSQDPELYDVEMCAEPSYPILGKKAVVIIESEDVHIIYRVAIQTRFEITVEQRVINI